MYEFIFALALPYILIRFLCTTELQHDVKNSVLSESTEAKNLLTQTERMKYVHTTTRGWQHRSSEIDCAHMTSVTNVGHDQQFCA